MYAPDQTYLLRSVRNLSHAQKSVLEQLHDAGIGVSRGCGFMEREYSGVQNLGFIRKDAYDHMNRVRSANRLANADADAVMRFLHEKNKAEPFFYWNVMMDITNGRLVNFYYRDARSAADYEMFGDVLSFDTTFKTNKYNLICAPFVGVNHHRQNIMFGMAFLSDETARSFSWLLNTFLDSMNRKEPQIIFSDQCQALMNAIDGTFTTAKHRLCQWHINQNAPAHFGDLNNNREFKKLWRKCMSECDNVDEFEETWKEMIRNHDLEGNSWFCTMYGHCSRWADVFTNDRFSAGLHATSRSEATNRIIKDLCSRSGTLREFIGHYEQIQTDWQNKERAEDAWCLGKPGQHVKDNYLLTHASSVYTRNVYRAFESEAAHTISVNITRYPEDYTCDVLEFVLCGQGAGEKPRRVLYNQIIQAVSCTCRQLDTEGVLCRHIFRVFYTINLRRLPDGCNLKRWRRAARNKSPNHIVGPTAGNIPNEMLFVNNIMRPVYTIAQDCKENAEYRAALHKLITLMYNDVCGGLGKWRNS